MRLHLLRSFSCILAVAQYVSGFVVHYVPPIQDYESHDTPDTSSNCETIECQTIEYITKSMNTSVDPCDNFYEYSCGGWLKENPVPRTQSHMNQFQIAEEKLQAQVKEILERDDPNDSTPVRAAGLYYRMCANEERIQKEGMSHLVKFLSEHSGWPMTLQNWDATKFNWQNFTSNSMRRLTISPLVRITVGLDRHNSSRSVILIDQPPLVLAREILIHSKSYGTQLDAYKRWIAGSAYLISNYLNESISVDVLQAKAQNVVDFEIELAKITSNNEMRRDANRMYNEMTLRSIQEWTDSASSTFKIDWLNLIQDIFMDTGHTITYSQRIIVRERDYLFHMTELLQNTNSETLANFLNWRMVRAISLDSTDEMRTLVSQFDQVYSGIVQIVPRWKDCLNGVTGTLNFAVGYAYVRKHFNEDSKLMAKEMIDNILATFSDALNKAEWMDEPTKYSALEKVNSMNLFIGYPEWYNNKTALYAYYDGLKVGSDHFENFESVRTFLFKQILMKLGENMDRNEWLTGPAIVNAFNNGFTNSIIIPAGILQLPFFSPKRIMAMNYGSIGAVIGHEILHSFDDTGRLTDKYGNLAQWWTENVIITYEKKAQCFIDQYSNISVEVPPSTDDNDIDTNSTEYKIHLNGKYTQGENIADNSGLRQAYYAYQKYVKEKGEEKLNGSKYTAVQLFFISYAMAWCESNTKESLLQEVLNDPHSPHRYRVMAPLSNFNEFSVAFNCAKNSKMNTEEKCIIW